MHYGSVKDLSKSLGEVKKNFSSTNVQFVRKRPALSLGEEEQLKRGFFRKGKKKSREQTRKGVGVGREHQRVGGVLSVTRKIKESAEKECA